MKAHGQAGDHDPSATFDESLTLTEEMYGYAGSPMGQDTYFADGQGVGVGPFSPLHAIAQQFAGGMGGGMDGVGVGGGGGMGGGEDAMNAYSHALQSYSDYGMSNATHSQASPSQAAPASVSADNTTSAGTSVMTMTGSSNETGAISATDGTGGVSISPVNHEAASFGYQQQAPSSLSYDQQIQVHTQSQVQEHQQAYEYAVQSGAGPEGVVGLGAVSQPGAYDASGAQSGYEQTGYDGSQTQSGYDPAYEQSQGQGQSMVGYDTTVPLDMSSAYVHADGSGFEYGHEY